MATKVFVSFRYEDGVNLKNELVDLFDSSMTVINRSEDVDRKDMTEETIRGYLYDKLKEVSVTIVILSPKAVHYNKNFFGQYDDWLYDEVRYSLEDRFNNRTKGVIALYTDSSEAMVLSNSSHTCDVCNNITKCRSLQNFDNLVRKNMINVKPDFKYNKCDNLFNDSKDSYVSLVHIDSFKEDFQTYIDSALEKKSRTEEFVLVKKL